MDGRRFDALARGIERRGLLRAVLLAAGLGAFATAPPGTQAGVIGDGFCEEKPKDARCRRNGQCCSGRCKKKRGKRKGRCRCSPLQARCSSSSDCCLPDIQNEIGILCDFRDMAAQRTCCMAQGGHCSESADCCGIALCSQTQNGRLCLNPARASGMPWAGR